MILDDILVAFLHPVEVGVRGSRDVEAGVKVVFVVAQAHDGKIDHWFLKGENMKILVFSIGAIMLAGCASITEFMTVEQPPPKVPQMVAVICPANSCTGGINWVQVDLCYGRAVRRAESYGDPFENMSNDSNSAVDRIRESNGSSIRERQRLNQEKAERADSNFESCLVEYGYEITPCDENATECRMQPSAAFIPL